MSGRRLEWDAELGRIAIHFRYDPLLIEEVKSLPGRRWHPDRKIWSAPIANLGEIARVLLPLGFTCSPQVEALVNGEVTSPLEIPAGTVREGEPEGAREPTWSVSELNTRAREALVTSLPASFWIAGEVIGYERNRHKRHVFFTLAEKGESDDRPAAQVTAVLFDGVHQEAQACLESAGAGELADGIQLRVRARVDLYLPSGSFQIVIEEVDPDFTLGEIARRQERILREVEELGVAEQNLSLPFPLPALKVALLTSLGSDAYNDFINELQRSPYAFEVTMADCHVQGKRVETDFTAALAYFAKRRQAHDVLVICRGGGSRTDLMGFDSLDIALAVARHPLKVLVGIGHHRDHSVLDFIATSEKTPTAAAQRLVALAREEAGKIEEAAERLVNLSRSRISQQRVHLLHVGDGLRRGLQARLDGAISKVRHQGDRLLHSSGQRLAREGHQLAASARQLVRGGGRATLWHRRLLAHQRGVFLRLLPATLRREKVRLEASHSRLLAVDPRRLLARGFAWLRRPDGSPLNSVRDAHRGDSLEVTLDGGTLDVSVDEVHLDRSEEPAT